MRTLITAIAAAALTATSLIGAAAANASGVPHGSVALYVISYGGQMPAKQAEQFAASTNKWLRGEGVPATRVTLTVAAHVSRKGAAKTGCSVMYALDNAITRKDAQALNALDDKFDTVIPIVVTPNKDNCGFAGQAWVGGSGILLANRDFYSVSERLRIFRHELGHNLGLGHFSTAPLPKKNTNLTQIPKKWNEYGDPTSIMGRGARLTYTDKYILGVVPAAAGTVATPKQTTYTIKARGKTDRLLLIPRDNTGAITLEYRPNIGVEARTLRDYGAMLWQKGNTGLALTKGNTVRAADTTITVTKTTKKSATVRVTWRPDTQAPVINDRSEWEFLNALDDMVDGRVTLTATDKPLTLDHTTTPTILDITRDRTHPGASLPMLPKLNDNTWVAAATLTINDTVVYQADPDPRALHPAGTVLSPDGTTHTITRLDNVPLYEGGNTMTLTISDLAGNTTTRHYTFTLRGLPD